MRMLPTVLAACLLVCLHGWTCVEANGLVVNLELPSVLFLPEDSGSFMACAVLNVSPYEDVNVTIATSERDPGPNSAQAGKDYVLVNVTFTFDNGTTDLRQCVNITIIDDDVSETIEFFDIEISATIPIGASDTVPVTINIDDSDSVLVELAETEYTIFEGGAPVNVCAVLRGVLTHFANLNLAFDVQYGTASGLDHNTLTPLLIPMGTPPGCKRLSALEDGVVEDTETFIVSILSDIGAAVTSIGNATVYIIDNDGANLTLVSETLSVEERNGGEISQVELCFRVNSELERYVGVLLSTMPGTAESNTDFEPLSNEMFIIPSTTRSIDLACYNLTIIGDDDQELNETFMVTASTINDVDQIYGADTITITILQDGDVSTARFQLKLVGDFVCEDWIKDNAAQKIEDIVAEVASELASRCGCPFTSELIANNSEFRCPGDPKEAVIFAQLFGVIEDDMQASAFINHLKAWVNSGEGSITVVNETLAISSECEDVEIVDFEVDPCPSIDRRGSSSDDDDDVGAIAGGVVGGVVLIALVIIVIIFIILIIRHNRTQKWDPKKDSGLLGSVELADNAAYASGQPPQRPGEPDPGYASVTQETPAQSAPEAAGETQGGADAPIPEYAVVQKKKKPEQPPQPDEEEEGEGNVLVFEDD